MTNNYFSEDINIERENLNQIILINIDLAQVIHDSKIKMKDSWDYYFETLIEKIIHTSLSITNISKGFAFNTYREKKLNIPMIDSPSMVILTRSVVECYLTLYYIYIEEIPRSERFFRFKLWQLSGLISRQGFSNSSDVDLNNRINEEKELIKKLRLEVEKDPEFSKLSKGDLAKLNKYGLPRLESWSKLIEKSNLKSPIFSKTYSLFSNYAHSEFLSTLQLHQSTRNVDDVSNINRIGLSFSVVKMINALIADWLKNSFKMVEVIFNTMPDDYQKMIAITKAIATKTNP